MRKFTTTLAASVAFALMATPAIAQDEPEEPRTTYTVTMLKFADGADDRWNEIMTEYVMPAQEAAGQTPDVIHWVMANPHYDIIVVSELEGGMGSFDTHANPSRDAFFAAMTELVGGEDELEALGEEWDTLVEEQATYYTHTHP